MAEEKENKVSKPYSLSPRVIAWIARKANQLSAESLAQGGAKVSDSQLVEDILTAAMEDDKFQTSPKIQPPTKTEKRNNRNAAPIAA